MNTKYRIAFEIIVALSGWAGIAYLLVHRGF
jgi:hypothetical protein